MASSGKGKEYQGDTAMCNYNFELPVEPVGLMGMVRQMVIDNGGSVTGQIPNVMVTFPTPMGQVPAAAGSCPATPST